MYSEQHIEQTEIDDLILKFTDETFSFRDAVRFQMVTSKYPEIIDEALANKQISIELKRLPVMKTSPGFEARLANRIRYEQV